MICGFNKSMQCTTDCNFYDTCTRKQNNSMTVQMHDNAYHDLTQFREYLSPNVDKSTIEKVTEILQQAAQYFMENNICKESIFDIYDVHELKRLLDIGKTDKKIRKTFRGKCVLLECGLSNYLDFVTGLNEKVVYDDKEIEKRDDNSDTGRLTSDYIENCIQEQVSSETADEEKLKMMNEDLEILLKRLKEEKGIK